MEYYYPKSSILKKHIRYISFYDSQEEVKQYVVFPNPGAGMVLCRDLDFKAPSNNIYISTETPGAFLNTLHINRIDPVKVIERGRQEKITIVFEPLGINHFIPESLNRFIKKRHRTISNLEQSVQFSKFAEAVYNCTTVDKKLSFIERYLLERYRDPQIPFVEEALTLLRDLDRNYSIEQISKMIYASPRNLLRLFQKHLCISLVEFRNIYQFRYSLGKKISSGKVSLKQISYESNYSDASYMVRMYKKFTGVNPSQFFDKVDTDKYVIMSL